MQLWIPNVSFSQSQIKNSPETTELPCLSGGCFVKFIMSNQLPIYWIIPYLYQSKIIGEENKQNTQHGLLKTFAEMKIIPKQLWS